MNWLEETLDKCLVGRCENEFQHDSLICTLVRCSTAMETSDLGVAATFRSLYPRRGTGLDITRGFCRVSQGLAQPLNCVIDAVIKIYESVGVPNTFLQFLARDNSAGRFQQNAKNLQRLVLEPDLTSIPAPSSRVRIQFKDPEPNDRA